MSNKRLLFVVDSAVPFLQDRFRPEEVELRVLPTAEIVHDNVKDADAIIGHTRTYCNEQMLRDTAVKMIATATIGMDHIDCAWCADHGITVKNAPGCNAPGVAQYVWASLLASGFNPRGATVGIVGHGNIGTVVADWGRKLGANVLLCDPPKARRLDSADYMTLEEMLPLCDAVTLHTPLTKTGEDPTYHLLDADAMKKMKDGAILINAARGAVLDTEALKAELNECRLKGIVDTWEEEPKIDLPLLDMVEIGTPHIAGYSLQGKQRATRMSLENIRDFFGVHVDTSGLAPAYEAPEAIDAKELLASYNPYADMARFVADPASFETLRATYDFRNELNAI